VGSASIILGKVDSGRFFYFFLTRSEPFREFSFPPELIKLFMSSQSRHLASLASIHLKTLNVAPYCRKRCGVRSSKFDTTLSTAVHFVTRELLQTPVLPSHHFKLVCQTHATTILSLSGASLVPCIHSVCGTSHLKSCCDCFASRMWVVVVNSDGQRVCRRKQSTVLVQYRLI
jgi:hypothetical protein